MTAILERIRRHPAREPLTEAYEVRAFRDESEQPVSMEVVALPQRLSQTPVLFRRPRTASWDTVNSACCPMIASSGTTIPATSKRND